VVDPAESSSAVHAFDVAGATKAGGSSAVQMCNAPYDPLAWVAATDIVAIPATNVAAATAIPVNRNVFLFILCFFLFLFWD
jgi:hypothetical protein